MNDLQERWCSGALPNSLNLILSVHEYSLKYGALLLKDETFHDGSMLRLPARFRDDAGRMNTGSKGAGRRLCMPLSRRGIVTSIR